MMQKRHNPEAARRWNKVRDEKRRHIPESDQWLHELVDIQQPGITWAHYESERDIPVVYFVQSENGGPIKIGASSTRSIKVRLFQLQIGNPEPLVVLRLVLDPGDLEFRLHRRFADLWIRGEWFKNEGVLHEITPGRGEQTFASSDNAG